MFLTRKTMKKINGLTAAFCIIGGVSLVAAVIFTFLGAESWELVRLGLLTLFLGLVLRRFMQYGEGKAKLIASANVLVAPKLFPGHCIHLYEEKRNDPDNVIAKPDFEVLLMLVAAYDTMGDASNALAAVEQMVSIAPERKKAYSMLLKASLLYANGRIAEADQLYAEALQQKMDMAARATADLVLKSDKAMAIGDYATAEAFFRQLLERRFPKNPPLSVLTAKFALGKICAATGRADEAGPYFTYCVRNGGQTSMQREAEQLLLTQ